jgi:hypothetical protein
MLVSRRIFGILIFKLEVTMELVCRLVGVIEEVCSV